jgi:MFS family permease
MAVFPALVLPLTATLGLDMPRVLSLSFWQFLLFGVTALPWGLAGDRIGGRPLMLLMFVGAASSGLAAAFWIDSAWELSLALAAIGMFSGIYHPIGMGLLSKGVKRLSLAMGYNAAFGGLGLVVAPVLTGVLNWTSGPQSAFLALAVLNAAGLLLMFLCPLKSSAAGLKRSTEMERASSAAFPVLLLATMLGGVAFTGATVVLPSYLELRSGDILSTIRSLTSGGLSGNLVATAVASAVYAVGMVGQYTGGRVGEHRDPTVAYFVFHTLCIPGALLMAYSQGFLLAGTSMVYFFFLLGTQALENTLVADFTPRKFHHSAFGLKFILTFGVGSVAVKIAGWIDAIWGVANVYVALAIVSVAASVTTLTLVQLVHRRKTVNELTSTTA